MVHLPLPLGVPNRRQLRGRLHRGPLRKLLYRVVVPQDTVLQFLAAAKQEDDAAAMSLQHFVKLALEVETRLEVDTEVLEELSRRPRV